jgi:hypothetical protein
MPVNGLLLHLQGDTFVPRRHDDLFIRSLQLDRILQVSKQFSLIYAWQRDCSDTSCYPTSTRIALEDICPNAGDFVSLPSTSVSGTPTATASINPLTTGPMILANPNNYTCQPLLSTTINADPSTNRNYHGSRTYFQ